MRARWKILGLAAACGAAYWGLRSAPAHSPADFIPKPGAYDVRILRDVWGVPHVFGTTDADTAYGLAWAQCEDDWTNTEDALLSVRSKLATKYGQEQAKIDYVGQLCRVRRFVDERYETDVPADVRAVVEAYAAGASHYAATHPDKCPYVELPITGKDIIAGFVLKAPFFYELNRQLEEIYGPERKHSVSTKTAELIPTENPFTDGRETGSNAFAIAPSRSADGATRLAINSHQPWDGQVAWYEAHLHSEQGWNMQGGTFPGGPVIFLGHDQNKGWAHTVNRPDLADIYVLDMNPDNPNQYKFDGQWRDMEVDYASITVKLWGPFHWTVKREILWTEYGPAIRTDHGVYAIRYAGMGDLRALEQWYRMNKAKNLDEFRAAMSIQGIPSFNAIYADKAGNIYYVYNGHFPERAPGYDWREYLPGNTSETLWTKYLPFDRVPQILNPASGFIQNCNSTPYETTTGEANPKKDDYPAWQGIETGMTNRATRLLELLGGDQSITREEFLQYKFDKHYTGGSTVAKRMEEFKAMAEPEDPLTRTALALVKTWDQSTDSGNHAAVLGYLACQPRMGFERNLPRDKDPAVALKKAAEFLMRQYGRLDVAWGDFARLRRGQFDLPLGGASDCVRCIHGTIGGDGRLNASFGDSLVTLVEWDKDGKMQAQSIHPFGAATVDTHSPHYDDQAPLFAAEQLKPVWLEESEIRQHLQREYRPGELKGAWYD